MDIQTQVAVLTGCAALAGSIVGSVASFYTTRMLKREEWLREHRLRSIARREEIYLKFYEEVSSIIVMRAQASFDPAAAMQRFLHVSGQMAFVGSEQVLKAAKPVGDGIMEAFKKPTENVTVSINGFVMAARAEIEMSNRQVNS